MTENFEKFNTQDEEAVEQPDIEVASEQIEMPEDFEDPEGKAGKWKIIKGEVEIEGRKVEVTYREKVIELSKAKQEKYGIQRIRRKEVIGLPPEFNLYHLTSAFRREREKPYRIHPDRPNSSLSFKLGDHEKMLEPIKAAQERFMPMLYYLTEGEFPSFKTVNHQMYGDAGGEDFGGELSRFKREGLYFQEVFPKASLGIHAGSESLGGAGSKGWFATFFDFENGDVRPLSKFPSSKNEQETRPFVYNFSVSRSYEVWTSNFENPMFVFGHRNNALKEYLQQIVSNPDTHKMLELTGYLSDDEKPLDLIDQNDPRFKTWKDGPSDRPLDNILEATALRKYPFFRDVCDKEKPLVLIDGAQKDTIQYDMALANGEAIFHNGHPTLPVVRHPDIKPFRWCHADCAIFPTKKGLNILFFETDKGKDTEEEK